jgi:zinc transporter ZupT
MIFKGINSILEAIFLSLSSGTFLYISASEVIIEEFSLSRYRIQKFIGFVAGALLIMFLTMFEYYH